MMNVCRAHFFITVGMAFMPLASALSIADLACGQTPPPGAPAPSGTFGALSARSIGPALMSGRVGDFAIDPRNPARYFIAVCSGGVWKTTNAGTTFTPVFDSQGSYSIGCVKLDPQDPNVVWVGTGENNSQRSVGFGDGVYRSRDGGTSWENLGLRDSEHIGAILVHPRDSNTVFVAAQGPLWRSGGDRGLYRTTDGGRSWERILHVDEDTGINEVHMDPRDPNVLFASAYQRRRHVWTLIDGGPGSAIYKSLDGGKSWSKQTRGLPGVDMGRIGLGVSPANPDYVYAIVEAAEGNSGVYRSTDRGETWSRRSGYISTSPQYYNELVCDPLNENRVYFQDTFLQVTEDGGRTFSPVPGNDRHVDDHALWIDPANTDHLLVGCDGGIYETWDRGQAWQFKVNLPVTQFYRVSVDNSRPFYNVYGGTQDNSSQGGPSRTAGPGITNEDWFVTVGGDGYETRVDPDDPNIVYSQYQYGGLVRHDRRSGQIADIKPREAPGEEPLRWNWDTPLILSPHHPKRLYFAANKLFRSDDGGDSWRMISGELSRGLDRNALAVMGKIQRADAVAKHNSTSIYGNSTALDESPLVEGLLYVGTDDGMIHVSEDGGGNWRSVGLFSGIPDNTYVSCLTASPLEADVVFAAFDNHKMGDFKPYLLRSDDRGRTWKPLSGDLGPRDIVYTLKQDHVDRQLLFVGTEFGAYASQNGGENWFRIAGLPTIHVRDLAIQTRENDLVIGTFGRGIWIVDDYSPLRLVRQEQLAKDALILPIKPALRFIERARLGSPRGFQGSSYFVAPNPAYGATITYHLKEGLKTRREQRREAEQQAERNKTKMDYPTIDQLRAEDEEIEPLVSLTIRDAQGRVVRRIRGPRGAGLHRVAWDLRYPSSAPAGQSEQGPLTLPGSYTVEVAKVVDGQTTLLAGPEPFQVVPLDGATFEAQDREQVLAFQQKVARLQRAVGGAIQVVGEASRRLDFDQQAVEATPGSDPQLIQRIVQLRGRLARIRQQLMGDQTKRRREEATLPSVNDRIMAVVGDQWNVTSPPTKTQRDEYLRAGQEFQGVLVELKKLVSEEMAALDRQLDADGAPWTPGRLPDWQPE